MRQARRPLCPDGSAAWAFQQDCHIQDEELTVTGFLESALDWSEYSGLIEVCPESLSPEADACRSHMSLRLNKKPRLEEPGQAKDL